MCVVPLAMEFGLTDTLNTKSFEKPIEEVGILHNPSISCKNTKTLVF